MQSIINTTAHMKNIYWKDLISKLIICLLCCIPAFVSAYNLRHFSNKNGLSNSAIQSLYQDEQGVLWIGTCDGLNVFDGNNIHLYSPVDVSRNLLSGNIISQIVESEPGILWLQTNYGLDRLDTYLQDCQTFTEFKDNIFLARSNNKCMLVLKDDGNLYHYQQDKQLFLPLNIPCMEFNKILSMTIDSNNLLWIFASEENTRCYRLEHTGKSVTLIPQKPFKQHKLKHAFVEDDSAYFIDETYALYEYSFSNRQSYFIADLKDEIEKRGEISSIIKREDDFCIGFKSSGLIILEYEENQKVKYHKRYTEIQSGIFCLMKDKFQDVVWVATDGEGLYMVYNDAFTINSTLLNTPEYQINNPVRSLFLDKQQTLWIGTKGSGVLRIPNYLFNRHNKKHDRLVTSNSTLTDNSVYCFAPGGKDRLWIGTENGVNYYCYSTNQLKELVIYANGSKVKYVHSIDQTNDSTLWLSTVGEGIVKVTLNNQRKNPIVKHATRTLVNNGHMASNYFFTSYREDSTTLWFGNRGLGAYRINVNTGEMAEFRFDNTVNSQTANDVFAIHKNKQGYWLGTGSGLLQFNPHNNVNQKDLETRFYTNSTIHGILEDKRGNLWVSTNQGLIRFNPNEQSKQTYNNENGLDVTEFSDGAFYKDKGTGILFFGGVNGFVTVRPDSYTTTDYMPEISLKGLSIYGKDHNIHDFLHYKNGTPILKLDYRHNFFQLNFRITDYINGNNYFYSYRLKEAGDKWIENGVSPNAIFSNLSPGEYTLLVKYRKNINGKESHPQSFTIHIAPPWYLSTWAYLSYFLIGFLVVAGIVAYALYTYRLKRQRMIKKMERQKKEEVYESKLRFFTNITHEFCTPLTLIQGPCEKILAHEKTDMYTQRYAKMIQQNVEKLNSLIVELLEFRRLETGNKMLSIQSMPVSEKLRDIAESFVDMAENREMNYKLDIAPKLMWNTDMSCFNKIAGNLISNAFKYTPNKGSICVMLYVKDEYLILKVRNTGKGITPENIGKIFDRYKILDSVEMNGKNSRNGLGLAICKNMVTLLKGEINIESTPGELTTFTVCLPILSPNGQEVAQTAYEAAFPNVVEEKQEIPEKITQEFDTNKQTIMVIDDDPSLLWFVSEIFTGKYNVLSFNNAQKALDSLEHQQPDLIISDVMMPEIDGLSFTSTVKQHKLWSHIPLILLSALHHEDDQVKGLESGADAYITKPFNVKYIEKMVCQLIRREKDLKEYYNSAFSTFSWKEGVCLHKEEQEFLEKMTDVIEKNLANPDLQVELLSKEMGFSSRQFYRKLKPLTDKSPADIIKEHRLILAERLLVSSNLTIDEVMDRTGFNNRSTFYKAFSQRYGMPPRQYCEEQKKNVKTSLQN